MPGPKEASTSGLPLARRPARQIRVPSPPPMPIDLPAGANDITDLESFVKVTLMLLEATTTAVNAGKSLTKSNKALINAASDEAKKGVLKIQTLLSNAPTAAPVLGPNSPPETPETTKLLKEISACLSDAKALRGELAEAATKASTISHALQSNQVSSQTKGTYAAVAGANKGKTHDPPTPPNPTSVIIVSAKNADTSKRNEILNKFKKAVSFKDTNFAPAEIRTIPGNKLKVVLDNEEQRAITMEKIKKAANDISAEAIKKLKPMVILKGIHLDTSHEELVDIIYNQNEAVRKAGAKEELVFKFKKSNRNNKLYNAVFITTPSLFKAIIACQKLNIDYQRTHVEEYSPLLQCYKCMQFGHTRARCTSDCTICTHCASTEHIYKDCPVKSREDKARCYNCSRKKNNTSESSSSHSATSFFCPLVQELADRLRTRIDYG